MSRKPADYELPQGGTGGNYSKLENWDNKFRVLSTPIIWWIYFTETPDGKAKPVRVRTEKEVNKNEIKPNKWGEKRYNHFWTFVVWDYQKSAISILELSKNSILKDFDNYLNDPDYSNPLEYDIIITKKGEGLSTEYSFRAGKHSPISQEIKHAYMEMPVDLEKLFEGGNPYEVDSVTKGLQNTIDVPFNPGE